jgi:hypothetical protein
MRHFFAGLEQKHFNTSLQREEHKSRDMMKNGDNSA